MPKVGLLLQPKVAHYYKIVFGRGPIRPDPARPGPTHPSRSNGWGTCLSTDDLKLGESTFLNTLNRFSKARDPEDIARYPNQKTSPVTQA